MAKSRLTVTVSDSVLDLVQKLRWNGPTAEYRIP